LELALLSFAVAPQVLSNVQVRPNLSFKPTKVFGLVFRNAPPNLGGLTQTLDGECCAFAAGIQNEVMRRR
jgi:hypothetical protein